MSKSSRRVSKLVVKVDFETAEIYIKSRRFSPTFLKKNEETNEYHIVDTKEEGIEVARKLLEAHAAKVKDAIALLKKPEQIRFVDVVPQEIVSFRIEAKQA